VSKKRNRIQPRDFMFEPGLFSFEQSEVARNCTIERLGALDSEGRERADERLCLAIQQFVRAAIEEAGPPPSEIRDRLRQIEQQAQKLDELITGGPGHAPEPLPAIRYALITPSASETGKSNLVGVTDDGITYTDDAPVVTAIEGVRAIERWVAVSLPRFEARIQDKPGGRQSGKAKAEFLSAMGDIFLDAKGRIPNLTAGYEGQAVGEFAKFIEEALEALLTSFLPAFYQAAPQINDAVVRLADSPMALYKALSRDVGIIKAGRSLNRKGKDRRDES
jgi:hypothetical protein